MNETLINSVDIKTGLLRFTLGLPWFQMMGKLWGIARKIMRGWSNEGVYEALDYECQIELNDKHGQNAHIKKRKKIRYLQDFVTSYLDEAWGDGEILLNYHCSPGIPVDKYRLGHKTYVLISLQEFKNKDDVDEFNMEWDMKGGFPISTGYWGTAVNTRMKKIVVKVIFPKERPPEQVSIIESNLRMSHTLSKESLQKLADGRVMVVWENSTPRLYENYILKWNW